ncbi:MAG: amidohydrolase [Candidatus Hodarchaeota archaeon]
MTECDLIIQNAKILTMNDQNSILTKAAVAINGNHISAIGSTKEITTNYQAPKEIEASGKVLMPGMVNGHTHLSMSLLRGIADDLALHDWLERIWSIETHWTLDGLVSGAYLAVLEMLRSGITSCFDLYAWQPTLGVLRKTGMRGSLALFPFESGKVGVFEEMIDDNRGVSGFMKKILLKKLLRQQYLQMNKHAEQVKKQSNGRIQLHLGIHSLYSMDTHLIQEAAQKARKAAIPLHIHLAETKEEVQMIQEQHQQTPTEFLHSIGFLGSDTCAAHCCWLSEYDIELLEQTQTNVIHCPVSNMKMASGVTPVPKLLEKNIVVGLGTDSAVSNGNLDFFEEMRAALLLQRIFNKNPSVLKAEQVLRMATVNGAQAIGLTEVGTIEEEKKADIILIDFQRPHLAPMSPKNLISNIVWSCKSSDVTDVIVDGQILLRERKFTKLSEKELLTKIQQAYVNLSRKIGFNKSEEVFKGK